MGWPTEQDIAARTGISITQSGNEWVTDYSLSVTELLARAKAHCETYCGREFDEATVEETHDGGEVIFVKRPPIVSVSSIEVDGDALDSDEYYVYTNYVRIKRKTPYEIETMGPDWEKPQQVTITYTGGYSDADGTHISIPAELKEIVLETACRWLLRIDEQYRSAKGATDYTVGNVRASFAPPDVEMADLYRRLDRYRVVMP